jgi:hypothetical protein
MALARQSARVLTAAVGVEFPDVVECMLRCGRLLMQQGRHADAIKDLQLAYAVHSNTKGRLCLPVAATADMLRTCCEAVGDHARALQWAKRAYDVRVAVMGDGDPECIAAYEYLISEGKPAVLGLVAPVLAASLWQCTRSCCAER